jgi:hypothetical protein
MQTVLLKKNIIPVDDSNIQILSQFILSKMKQSLQWRQHFENKAWQEYKP